MKARVIKSTGSWITLETEEGQRVPARVRGQLRIRGIASTNPIAVGDEVEWELQQDGTGLITDIHERRNCIIRKSVNLSRQTQILAANIDMAWLVVTPVLPKTSTGFIDRFLAAAESYHIPAGLIFNKSDLFRDELQEVQHEYLDVYRPLDYPCICVSALSGEGIEELRQALKGKLNLFAGHSGVGKSSLINSLAPALQLKTGSISLQHLKGKHTTTFAEMHRMADHTYLIDTPGIREFVNIDFKPAEIGHYFKEIRARMQECKFNNCLHDLEKGCAVKAAVEEGQIHPQRYYNYLGMLHQEDHYR